MCVLPVPLLPTAITFSRRVTYSETGEFQDEGLVERRNCREVEAVEALDRWEPRFLDPTLHHASLSIDQLQFGEAQQKADMVETLGGALPSKLLILGARTSAA